MITSLHLRQPFSFYELGWQVSFLSLMSSVGILRQTNEPRQDGSSPEEWSKNSKVGEEGITLQHMYVLAPGGKPETV